MPSPSDLLKKLKSAISSKGSKTDAGPVRSPKPSKAIWLSDFSELAEKAGVKKPGTFAFSGDLKQRKALMAKAASHGMAETMGFVLCGMYYVTNPKNPRLAKGIKDVFLTPSSGGYDGAGSFALNIDAKFQKEIDVLANWGGYNDISAMLDSAADGIMNGQDATIGSFMDNMNRQAGSSGVQFAKTYMEGLARELSSAGWKPVELAAVGLG